MALTITQRARIIFGFGATPGVLVCSTEADKTYQLSAPTNDGTLGTLNCVVPSHTQALTIGGGVVTQNTHWGGSGNHIWLQKDWEVAAAHSFGIYGTPTCKMYGCYMNASCVGGFTNLPNSGIPRINATVQGTPTLNSCVVRVIFDGQIKLSEDADIKIYQDDGTGTWTLLTTITCPANTQNNTSGYVPYVDVPFTSADAGNSFHFKAEVVHTYSTIMSDIYITIGSNVYDLPDVNAAENSFVQFGDGSAEESCGIVRNVCMPVVDMDEVQFQLVVDAASNGAYNNFPAGVLGDGITRGTQLFLCVCEDCEIPADITHSDVFLNAVAKLDDWENDPDTDIWTNQTIDWADLKAYLASHYNTGDCFRICLCSRVPDDGSPGEWIDTVLGCMTDCFKVVDSSCYTSILTYKSDSDNFCFHYVPESSFINSIRLPLYLRSPQYPSTEKGYQKSDGTFIKLSERINEEWLLETDWLPAEWHKRLKIALSHDTVNIDNSANSGINEQVYCNVPYDIAWEKRTLPYPLAKGNTKVFKAVNNCRVNSNC